MQTPGVAMRACSAYAYAFKFEAPADELRFGGKGKASQSLCAERHNTVISTTHPTLIVFEEEQQVLTERFSALEASRTLPVYFIEHGLSADEREALADKVRGAAQTHALDSRWWDSRDLPLIVASTEIGYRYRGNGTDFWPVLKNELNVSIGTPQRRNIRRLFTRAAEKFRGAEPPASPWAQAFHLIAWPITHSLVPLELHRPLAVTLARLRGYAAELDDTSLNRLLRVSASDWGSRFKTLLEDEQRIVPVVRSLLDPDRAEGFSPEIMRRISADLETDGVARQRVRAARNYQAEGSRRRSKRGSTDTPTRRTGSLQLRRTESRLRLEGVLPTLPGEMALRVRRVLRRRHFTARLWEVSHPIASEQFLVGIPFRIDLEEIPSPEAFLFEEMDEAALDEEVVHALSSFELPISRVMIFAVSPSGDLGRFVAGPKVSAYHTYWALVPREGYDAPRAPRIGQVGPYDCYLIEPEDEHQRTLLAELGFEARREFTIDVIGPAPIGLLEERREYLEGDQIYLVPRRSPEPEYRVVRGEEEKVSDTDHVVTVAVAGGDNVVRFRSDSIESVVRWSGRTDPLPTDTAACSIQMISSEPSVPALVRGEVSVRITSHAPLEHLDLEIELSGDGWRRSERTLLPSLPASIHSGQPVFRRLVEELGHGTLAMDSGCSLRLTVGNLASRTWLLDARTLPCWWERGDEGDVRLASDLGGHSFGIIPAANPCSQPEEGDPQKAEEPILLAPQDLDPLEFGASANFATLCIAPPSGSLSLDTIRTPDFRRSVTSSGDRLGLEALVEAYLKWAVAESWNPLAELRRHQVALEIDRWIARVCCGDHWVLIEDEYQYADPWRLLEEGAYEAGLGRDAYVEGVPEEVWRDVIRDASSTLQNHLPTLWAIARPSGRLQPAEWLLFEQACDQGYANVAAGLDKSGQADLALRLRDADASADFNHTAWGDVITDVIAENDLATLAAKILPSDSAPYFMAIEPSDLSLDDVSEELHRWGNGNPGAFFGSAPSRQAFHTLAAIWIEPGVAIKGGWREVLDLMISERSACRAARYIALRVRQTRRGEER